MTKPYGCHNRKPFAPHYLPTGALDLPQYRIKNAFTQECQYRKTDLGKSDPGCIGCKHKLPTSKA